MTTISISFVILVIFLVFMLRRHLRNLGKTTEIAINHLDNIVKVNLAENEVDLIKRLNKVSEEVKDLQYSSFEEAYEALKKSKKK